MLRWIGPAVWSALGAFHLWLLATQAWAGHMDSAESIRWLLALAFAGGLVALKRQGRSLLRDRRATALWVLVALLHGPVLGEGAQAAEQALAESTAIAAPLAAAALGLALTAALTLARRASAQPRVALVGAVLDLPAGRPRTAVVTVRAPRPPPLA